MAFNDLGNINDQSYNAFLREYEGQNVASGQEWRLSSNPFSSAGLEQHDESMGSPSYMHIEPYDMPFGTDLRASQIGIPRPPDPPSPQTHSENLAELTEPFTSTLDPTLPFTPFDLSSTPQASPGKDGFRILVQPNEYQIVNYNVYPAPELEFSRTHSEPITVQALLVYCDENVVAVQSGFTNGDVQVLKVGQTRVTFPALHLNRMTPIKNSIQQSGLSVGPNFSITFKVGAASLTSTTFKLVSACNQIPEGIDVRPRKLKEKFPKEEKVSKAVKRRATNEPPMEEDVFFKVKVRGEASHRGFISVHPEATLKTAREEIAKSNNYPPSFRFWFDRMATIVQLHQEDAIRAENAADGNCLIIEPYDLVLTAVDNQVLALWLSQKNVKDPLVPLPDLIRHMFSVYRAETRDKTELDIINGGVSHFLANVARNRPKNPMGVTMVSLEDFKLFLKFFGTKDCLSKVLSVYREPYFHGFARYEDAVNLLRGKPGYFLVRYSESQLKDGFFAFCVNKGNTYRDQIENYSLQFDADQGCFLFKDTLYPTLRDFATDPKYAHILCHGLVKTTVETIKESKYLSPTHLVSS